MLELKELEQKFLNLIPDQKLSISDEPFFIENFIDIKKYLSADDILNDAINNDFIFWDLYDNVGPKIEVPYKNPYWFFGQKQQHKFFIIDAVNKGHTFVIFRCSILNEKLKQLTSIIQKCFHVSADLHVYGSKGKGGSFVIHADLPVNFIIQLEGETDWVVFNNKVSNLLSMPHVLQKEMKFHKDKFDKFNLEHLKQSKGLEPIINTTLKSGDLLYIPSRYYHCALPKSPRMSISIPCVNSEIMGDVIGTPIDTNIYKF